MVNETKRRLGMPCQDRVGGLPNSGTWQALMDTDDDLSPRHVDDPDGTHVFYQRSQVRNFNMKINGSPRQSSGSTACSVDRLVKLTRIDNLGLESFTKVKTFDESTSLQRQQAGSTSAVHSNSKSHPPPGSRSADRRRHGTGSRARVFPRWFQTENISLNGGYYSIEPSYVVLAYQDTGSLRCGPLRPLAGVSLQLAPAPTPEGAIYTHFDS